jgi:hypothetical protein
MAPVLRKSAYDPSLERCIFLMLAAIDAATSKVSMRVMVL